jgi:hypothetical protein
MGERALRGARLGTQSFEDERGVEMAPRQQVEYVCADGHTFTVIMADEAEIPFEWEDPKTGQIGQLADGVKPEGKAEKPIRTHWDMLLERRSVDELEEILTERLELLRGGSAPAGAQSTGRRRNDEDPGRSRGLDQFSRAD